MGHMTLGDHARGGFRAPVGGLSGSKSRAIFAMALQQQASAADAAAKKEALAKVVSLEAAMDKIDRLANAARDQAFSVSGIASQVDHPSAFSMSQDAQDQASDIDALSSEARQVFNDAERQIRSQQGSGAELLRVAESASESISMISSRIQRSASALALTTDRLKKLQIAAADEAERARLAEEQRLQAIEDARQRELDRQAAEDERLRLAEEARLERERAARELEAELQREQLEEARRLAEEERQYEAAERARIAQIEQARIDAEMRREQMALDAEMRREQRAQEAALRAEEAEIRRQEREAQLQQLMLIQELASAGLPVQNLPAGLAPPQPQVQPGMQPQGSGFFLPGFATPAPTVPSQQQWTPYGPVVGGPGGQAPTGFAPTVPGATLMPFQAAPAGYAATAPQPYAMQPGAYQQTQPSPYGDAPPGFAWQGFDPGTEMFGLGALRPTYNPNFEGALIEENWYLRGPDDDGMFSLIRPSGQLYARYSEDQLYMGAIRDSATNQLVFVPPAQRPDGGSATAAAVTSEIAATIREAIKATGSVMTEKERRKAAKYGTTDTPSLSVPGAGYSAGAAPTRMPNVVWIVAGLAAAGAAVYGISRLAKGKDKE